MNHHQSLINFRESLYQLIPSRCDAVMDLIDAIALDGYRYNSVVKLSQSLSFKRSYSSITDAISALADNGQDFWAKAFRLVYEQKTPSMNQFAVDVTSNPRPHAKTLSDKVITHSPNPAPSNSPICVGHAYSVIVGLDQGDAGDKKWVSPLSVERVKSSEKGNEIGMQQLETLIQSGTEDGSLNVSFGDSLYGTAACRKTATQNKDWVHIYRLRITRNIFQQPDNKAPTRGRKPEYGHKISIKDPEQFPSFDEVITTSCKTHKGKTYAVTISCWHDMLLRGTNDFKSSEHPINVIRVEVTDSEGNAVFVRPLWLALLGERRHEVTIEDAYKHLAKCNKVLIS